MDSGNWWKPEPYTEIKKDNLTKGSHFRVTINSAQKSITLSYTLSDPSPITLEMYNSSGRKIAHHTMSLQESGNHAITLPLHDYSLSGGLYIITLQTNEKKVIHKVTFLK